MEHTPLEISPQFISRGFQNRIYDFLTDKSQDNKIMILNAPTGSGKTYSFKFLEDSEGFSFIVLPNNFLIEEKVQEFSKLIDGKKIGQISSPSVRNALIDNGVEMNKESFLDYIFNSIYGKKIIITNPSFLFLVFYNFYWSRVHGRVGGMIQELITRGLKAIIFDEFHVYSPDQRNRIISLCLALYGKVKFIYCSATLPKNLESDLGQVFGMGQISTVHAVASDDTGDLLRGGLNVEIYKALLVEIVKHSLEDLKKGNWCLIVNRIRTISEIRDLIYDAGIPSEDVLTVSGFHDPERESIRMMIEGHGRIVIASNIIEQGFNPNKKFTNFIIEQGKYDYNFLQRIGRIGRGTSTPSKVMISAESYFEFNGQKVTFDYFTDRMTLNMKKEYYKFSPYRIGFYLAAFLHFTSQDVQSIIYDNLNNLGSFRSLIQTKKEFTRIIELIDGLEHKRSDYIKKGISLPETELIPNWWRAYIRSFARFIRSDEKIDIIDLTAPVQNNSVSKAIDTRYGEIWTRKNMEGSYLENGKFQSSGFRDEAFKDFELEICGIPWKCVRKKLRDIEWVESDIMKECIRDRIRSSAFSRGPLKEYGDALRSFVELTAFPERLDMKVIED